MSDQDQSPFETAIFAILAGSTGKRFFAHAAVLAKSDRLRVQIEGKREDTLQHELIWKDWDEGIVKLFLQWLYTGDYDFPYPMELQASVEIKDEFSFARREKRKQSEELENMPSVLSSFKRDDKGKGKKRETSDRPLTTLADMQFIRSYSAQPTSALQKFDAWFSSRTLELLDFEHSFLTNAKLYVMADHLFLSELQILALHYLQYSLEKIQPLNPESLQMSNVVRLIDYVYEHTAKATTGEHLMRRLVSEYAALQFTNFKGDEVQQLMAKGGDFIPDLMQKLQTGW